MKLNLIFNFKNLKIIQDILIMKDYYNLTRLLPKFKLFILLIIIICFAEVFVFDLNKVISDSMSPLLKTGDTIIISKLHFGYISLSEIKRFDVVLFKKDGKKTVKRCIGKAGESFQIINDVIFINSLPIESYNYQSPNPNDIKIETSLSVFELIRKNKWTLKNFGEFMIPYKDFKIKLNKSNKSNMPI